MTIATNNILYLGVGAHVKWFSMWFAYFLKHKMDTNHYVYYMHLGDKFLEINRSRLKSIWKH